MCHINHESRVTVDWLKSARKISIQIDGRKIKWEYCIETVYTPEFR